MGMPSWVDYECDCSHYSISRWGLWDHSRLLQWSWKCHCCFRLTKTLLRLYAARDCSSRKRLSGQANNVLPTLRFLFRFSLISPKTFLVLISLRSESIIIAFPVDRSTTMFRASASRCNTPLSCIAFRACAAWGWTDSKDWSWWRESFITFRRGIPAQLNRRMCLRSTRHRRKTGARESSIHSKQECTFPAKLSDACRSETHFLDDANHVDGSLWQRRHSHGKSVLS